MNPLFAGIYRMLHARPLVDVAYFTAGTLQPVKDRYDDWVATRDPVPWEELKPWLGLNPSVFFVVTPSSICNARCVFCAYPQLVAKGYRGAVMPMETFQRAVREWESIGGRSLNLTPTVGEVLTDPGFFDKLAFARSTRIPDIRFYTNGLNLHLNENWRKMVDGRPDAILISLGGCDPVSYRRSFGVDGYANLIKGISLFLDYDKQQGYPVDVTLAFRPVQSGWRLTDTEDFRRIIRPHLGPRVRYTIKAGYDNWGGVIAQANLPRPMRLRPARRPLSLPCINLFQPAVLPDGTLRCCACRIRDTSRDELEVGNIHENTLADLMKSARFQALLRRFYEGNRPAICQGCSLYRPINRPWFNAFQAAANSPAS